ncbi:uncharacterized protein ACHE_50145S [Aspergillus chevalieri]|uniref:DEUBAD domain-containing protein n=1 Tax=Aspergillus chevalieri TaxID=182096 RepID=A0A7R7VQI6_ASPCH|nr:uncharacterized protein ACHE_50145S [Aspergillus chevalieri]BCR88947.1 hypothetical protein ACHE_50145S [Aspergillus chevalieri]
MSANTRAKRNPRRGATKSKWDEERVMTSPKSPLINADLVKMLANRKAWDVLEEHEKEEILDLLPEHIRPHPKPCEDGTMKIPPIAESFLRYDNPWRDAVRQFQVDLENGRYDPEWIRQADIAVQERANGDFDDFKEREFEEFWGQKQRMDKSLAAGESSQIKLTTLVEHGVVRTGDVWKLSRGFNVPGGRVLIEKEAKILKIDGSHMTCVVPAGQRVFLPQVPDADYKALLKAYKSTTEDEMDVDFTADGATNDGEGEEEKPTARGLRKRKSEVKDGPRKKRQQDASEDALSGSEVVTSVCTKQEQGNNSEDEASKSENDVNPETGSNVMQSSSSGLTLKGVEVVVLPEVNGPTYLGNKMIEVDGRIKHIPNGNAWKEFRCYRDNQDMGSLWEVRQAWYVRRK